MDEDDDRYAGAEGWDGSDNGRKRRRKNTASLFPDFGRNPFELAAGSENSKSGNRKPAGQLFGSLWRAGETAVLFGDAGIGKSVLAVQIAESIARGSADTLVRNGRGTRDRTDPESPNPYRATVKPQKVLYIDFERTRDQFDERYSAPSPIPGKLPVGHRFPRNLIPLHLGDIDYIPPIFKNAPHRYLSYWLHENIEEKDPRVLIIDNIAYLARTLAGGSGTSLMKTLKLWAARFDISILAVAHRRPHKRLAPVTLADLAAAPGVADLADTVFAIGPSTCGHDIRYIKHLKSRSSLPTNDAANVIVCRISRTPSANVNTNNLISEGSSLIPHSALRSPHSEASLTPHSAIRSPQSEGPFLGFTHLGFSDESFHLIDHVKNAQLAEHREREQLRKSKSVVNTLMSREYQRYLDR